ncbi:MAG: aminotransferase class V-fold PLP-dependent enzyme [Pirellulaceae bacterium]
MENSVVYLDHHATTPVDPRVLEVMLPYFTQVYGNPASIGHLPGEAAKEAVEQAQAEIAGCLGAQAREIVFTSGATESNNLAIFGVLRRRKRRGDHVISVTIEHRAVLDPLESVQHQGFEVTLLQPQPHGHAETGRLDPQQISTAIRDDTALVSVMLANNEIGAIQDIAAIGEICRERSVPFHCDATQGVGKVVVDVEAMQVDLMSFTAHKMYGPKGIGALYVRGSAPRVRLDPQILGGGQQRGLRSGTLNVPGIIGLAAALRISLAEREEETERLIGLRSRLFDGLRAELPELVLNGPTLDRPTLRLAGNLNVAIPGVDGEALMMNVRQIAVSSGSACTSANPEPSHVLRALGLSDDLTRSSLRFGLGRFNTSAEIDFAVEVVSKAVHKLRKLV